MNQIMSCIFYMDGGLHFIDDATIGLSVLGKCLIRMPLCLCICNLALFSNMIKHDEHRHLRIS
jgi:hypothetical protein